MAVSSTGTLSAPGGGSGLDINTLVSKLMAVEQQPLTALNNKEASYQAKLSSFGTLKSALSSLQTAAQALATPAKLSPIKATVADPTILSGTPTASAVAGTYNIEVQSLAQSQKLNFAGFVDTTSANGVGTLTFNFGSYTADNANPPNVTGFTANPAKASKNVVIDASNYTLTGIRDAVNSANIGVSASIINDGSGANPYRLVFTSTDTGASNAMQITTTAGLSPFEFGAVGTSTANQIVAAKDAVIKVDNVTITKPNNVITDAVQGVTLNLAKEAPGTTTKMTLTRDTSAVQNAVKAFVDAYNAVNKNIGDATSYDPATKKAGALNGDSTIRSIQTQLRNLLTKPVSGAPSGLSVLSDVGITFQKDGSLAIDSTALNAAIADPNKDLSKLFASSGTARGYASQANLLLGSMLSPIGMLTSHTKSINSSISDISKQRTALNVRLVAKEQAYRNQFNAMDTAVGSMQQTSAYLTQQLSAINANSKG